MKSVQTGTKTADAHYHRWIPRKDFDYHLLGNGLVQAVVQINKNKICWNAVTIYLTDPGRFENRFKQDSLSFHQRFGPEPTCVLFSVGSGSSEKSAVVYIPNPQQIKTGDMVYEVDFSEGFPVFKTRYSAVYTPDRNMSKSSFEIEEIFFCPVGYPAIIREIIVTNKYGKKDESAVVAALMSPNQKYVPDARYIKEIDSVMAGDFRNGDEFIAMTAFEPSSGYMISPFPEKFDYAFKNILREPKGYCDKNNALHCGSRGAYMGLKYDTGKTHPGESKTVVLVYGYGTGEKSLIGKIKRIKKDGLKKLQNQSVKYWRGMTKITTGEPGLDDLFQASCAGTRAVISKDGKMNAGLWGYNLEWVRDSSMVCLGAIMSGQFDIARKSLAHQLEVLVKDDGYCVAEGIRGPLKNAELDLNGMLLYTLWTYLVYTADDSLIRKYWKKIVLIAEFPVQDIFWSDEAGMVHNERESIWERNLDSYGIEDGFELETNMWVSIGLENAAWLAGYMNEQVLSDRWRKYSKRIWNAVLHSPKYSLVEKGHFIKRKMLNGKIQYTAYPRCKTQGMPNTPTRRVRCLNRECELEPDSQEVLPIAFGLVVPRSSLAKKTLDHMEKLWNQEWNFGGYSRCNVTSEPNSPGGWPLSTLFVARAALEAGQHKKVWRALKWMQSIHGSKGYFWLEYLDSDRRKERNCGMTPWNTYAELIMFFIYNLIGFRPEYNHIQIRPSLLPELTDIHARIRYRKWWVDIEIVNCGRDCNRVLVNGRRYGKFDRQGVVLPAIKKDTQIRMFYE